MHADGHYLLLTNAIHAQQIYKLSGLEGDIDSCMRQQVSNEASTDAKQ